MKLCLGIFLILIILIISIIILLIKKEKYEKNYIIHQTWKTISLPENFKKWSKTWKDKNPDWKYKLWTDNDNRNFIKQYYPWFLKTYDNYNINIKRVDAVRYFYLYHYGGLYVDLDFKCIKNMKDILKNKIVLGKMGNGKCDHCIPNAFMYSPKSKHPFWKFCIDQLYKKGEDNKSPEETTGPIHLKTCYELFKNKKEITLLDSHNIYPIDWRSKTTPDFCKVKGKKFNENKCKQHYKNAYAITYWTHTW